MPSEHRELVDLESRYVMQTYARAPVTFVRGDGAWLYDSDGDRYLDFLAGISVCSAGHCHPKIVEAVRSQAAELLHASNLFYSEPMIRLAERLVESSLGGKVFFANSGTEANECAIKIARKHAHSRGIEQPVIVSFDGDFHGRTYGSLAATPRLAADPDFGPMLPGFRSVPFNDPEALTAAVDESTAAVFVEPIQGEAGVWPLSEETVVAIREACDRVGALLIFDEVQTGMGRTGSLWAYEQLAARPDLMTVGKALGGGMAIGACVVDEATADVLEPGDHGSTFAGGPVASAAALATLGIVDDPDLLRTVRDHGRAIADGLREVDGVREVRGRGLMLGVGLENGIDAAQVNRELLTAGLVANSIGPSTLRLLPPLVITGAEAELGLKTLSEVIMRHHMPNV